VFRAERFVARRYGPYEYLPFGGGARRCIGMQLACFEMRIVLGTVVANARLSLLDPGEVRPRRRSVTIAPDAGPRFRVLGTGEAHARTG
jgi:cytochrome P450